MVMLVTLILPTVAFADTNEPGNNTMDGAILLAPGTLTTSYISNSTDVDFYKVVASTDGPMLVEMTPATGKNYDIEILDESGAVLAGGHNTTTGASGIERVTSPAAAGATYYLRVYGVSGAYTTAYTYSIKYMVDPEVNDSADLATPLADGGSAKARIFQSGDSDYFVLTPTSSGSVTAKLTVPSGLNYDLQLLSGNGMTVLAGGYQGAGITETITYQVQEGTPYYLRVFGVSGAYSASLDYTLTAVVDLEPNNSTTAAMAVAADTDIKAKISTSTDADWYTFTTPNTPQGKVRVVVTLDVPDNLDYTVSLLQTTTLGTGTGGAGEDETLDLIVNANVKHYIKVTGVSSAFSTTANYVLRYSLLDVDDNPSYALTTVPGYPMTGFLSTPADVDFLKVDAEAAKVGGALDVTFTAPDGVAGQLDVVDAAGTPVCSGTSSLHCDFAPGAVAYFKVSSADGSYSTDSAYTIDYDFTPDVTTYGEPNDTGSASYPIVVDAYLRTYKASLATDTDDDFYKFTAPVTGNFTLSMTGSDTVNYDYYLYDITGGTLTLVSSNYDPGTSGMMVGRVTASRVYQIRVMRAAGSAGGEPYTFQAQITDDLGEPNDSIEQAYVLAPLDNQLRTYYAKASGTGESDVYRMQLVNVMSPPEGDLVVVVTGSGATTDKLEVVLYDGDTMQELSRSATSSGTAPTASAIVRTPAAPDKPYILTVTSLSGTDHKYTFTTQVLKDFAEPNESYTSPAPIAVGQSFDAYIATPVDDDNYILTATKSGTLTVTITQTGSGTATVVYDSYLYSMGSGGTLGTLLAQHYSDGINATLTATVTSGKQYLIRVRRAQGHGAPYKLTTSL
jgi:hypothetical protein